MLKAAESLSLREDTDARTFVFPDVKFAISPCEGVAPTIVRPRGRGGGEWEEGAEGVAGAPGREGGEGAEGRTGRG